MTVHARCCASALAVFTLVTLFAPGAAADESDIDDAPVEEAELQSPFGPGNIDVNAGIGSSNSLVYLNVEPGLNVGLVGPSDGIVLSAGATLNLGYCLGCHLFDLTGVRVRARQFSPMVRGSVHLPVLMNALGAPEIDARVGMLGGIGSYGLDIGQRGNDPEIAASVRTTILGPYIGGTYSRSDDGSGPFGFLDLRLLFEVGTSTVTIDAGDDDEDRVLEVHADVSRQGLEGILGVGYRF